jgi:alpha-1,2-mannosyltransferase
MAVASTTGAVSGILLFTAAAGVTGSWQWAIPLGIVGAALIGLYIWRKRLLPVDERACSRALLSVGAVSGIVLLVQLARLAVFMVNPSQAGYSTIPTSRWEVRHSCLSAYYVAANAAEEGADVYADALYSLPGNPTALRRPRTLGAFNIDVYEYPPPFLLLPRAAQYVASDFIRLRAFWFAFNAALVVIALLAIRRSLEPGAASRALLLSPLVLLALPTLGALQKGNVQLIVVAVSMVAMLCFQRGRFAIGGAMLGFAIVSKLYPGLLIIYLLLRREWRPVLWTAAMAALFAVVALIDTGWAPYAAFLEHFLKLMSGEAFPAFRNPAAVASNMSIPGLVFKLKPLGIADLSFGAAKIVGWAYTMVAVGTVILVARQARPAGAAAFAWLGILIVATLRSPFLPQGYGVFPAVWLLTLLAAAAAPTGRTLIVLIVMWLLFHLYLPPDWPIDVRLRIVIAFVPQTAMIVLAVMALRSYRSSTFSSPGARS